MIESHQIKALPFHQSPNVGGVMANLPTAIVIHYTGDDSLSSTVKWLCDRQARASAHIVVGESGEMVQLVPFNHIAWHAGKSHFNGLSSFNHFSIGIELVNPGKLVKVGDVYRAWFGKEYPHNRVVTTMSPENDKDEHWCSYPVPQLKALKKLILLLKSHYPIDLLVGHEEISPGRKVDPGPAFPLDDLRRQLMDIDRDGSNSTQVEQKIKQGVVHATQLNLRETAGGEARTGPLKQGQSLRIIGEQQGWYQVQVKERGWVKKEYVRVVD